MKPHYLCFLGRDEYIHSISHIDDEKTQRFADQSLAWWDRHASWKTNRCAVLCDGEKNHLCYLFSRIDRYGEYITLYNLFTPLMYRRHGYATDLLRLILGSAVEKHVRRITFSSVSGSLDFYRALGFIYWGINEIGDYYCNLPLPIGGLDAIEHMSATEPIEILIGNSRALIHSKVDGNEEYLSFEQNAKYEADKNRLGENYAKERFEASDS